jgi:hypothetical protein
MNLMPYSYFNDCFLEGKSPKTYNGDPDTLPSSIALSQGNELTPGELDSANATETTNVVNALTFVEQKPAITSDNSVAPARNDSIMFGEWDARRILGKPVRLGTYAFSTSQTQGTYLRIFNVPQIATTVGGSWTTILSAFTFFKARTRIRVQINGNRFSAGRLIAFAVPWNMSGTVATGVLPVNTYVPWIGASAVTNLSAITALPHVFLDASSNDVSELVLPFVAPYEWYNLAIARPTPNPYYVHAIASTYGCSALWTICLAVFNPLSVGTGAPTSIYASIWLSFEDVELCVPRLGAAASQGGTHSSVVNNISNWDSVATMTLPNNVTGDKFDIKADVGIGMDKPNNTLNPIYVVRRALGYMPHARNIENSNRFALIPSGTDTAMPSDFGTDEDEMSLEFIFTKYTYWYTFNVTTTQLTNTPLTYIPVTPYILPSPTGYGPALVETANTVWDGSGGGSVMNPPLLSYAVMPFNFWGGSIDYRFDFITNSFVTMKVFAAIVYGTTAPETPPTGAEPTTGLGYTFEVNSDNKTFEINVPYVADTPWKRVMRSQFIQTGTSGAASLLDDSVGHECCIGQVVLYVINPLVPPAGLPNTYPVNVFVRGGKDFRVNYVSRANTSFYPVSQGKEDDAPTTAVATLGQVMRSTHLAAMSDSYVSLRDLLKRFSFVGAATIIVPAAVTPTLFGQQGFWSTFIPIVSFFGPNNGNLPYNLTLPTSTVFAWFARLYRFSRGSLRFKILYDVPSIVVTDQIPTFSVDYAPDYYKSLNRQQAAGGADVSTGPTTTDGTNISYNVSHLGPRDIANDTAPFNEIEIPHVYPNRVRPVPYMNDPPIIANKITTAGSRASAYSSEVFNYGSLVINVPILPASYTVIAKIYMAIGDDFRFGRFLAQPSITYGGMVAATSPTSVLSIPPDFYS